MEEEGAALQKPAASGQARMKRDARDNKEKDEAKLNSNRNTVGEKNILLGRGRKLFWDRHSNIHLRNFVEIFRDHYENSGHTERHRIVGMIIDLLQNDGYSFLKSNTVVSIETNDSTTALKRRKIASPRTQLKYTLKTTSNSYADNVNSSISCSKDFDSNIRVPDEDRYDKEDDNGSDDLFIPYGDNYIPCIVASPSDVHKEITRLFQKHHKRGDTCILNASSSRNDPTISTTQYQEQQQHLEALHHAITAAIDTSSLVATIRSFPSPDSSPLLSSTPPLMSPLRDETLDQPQRQEQERKPQHLLPQFFPLLPASLPEIKTGAEKRYVTTITARTSASASASATVISQSENNPTSITTIHARQLLGQHLGSTLSPTSSPPSSPKATAKWSSDGMDNCSYYQYRKTNALPKDGVLWSKGTRKISLLEDMSSSLVPITSYTLFPNAEDNAFGASSLSVAESPRTVCNATAEGTMRESPTTIGYTQQEVGHLTILRPIVLLPGVQSHGSANGDVDVRHDSNENNDSNM